MRKLSALGAMVLLVVAAPPVQAQRGIPPGSYQRQCRDIQLNGVFLSAWCQGTQGSGRSSLNIGACGGDIFVDPSGALTCVPIGGGGRPPFRPPPPAPAPPFRPPGPGFGFGGATLFAQPGWRGQSLFIQGPTPDLHRSGMNDRTRSIQLDRRSGPWLVCTDANYRGRCTTISSSIQDTRQIGMWDSISSLRPVR